MVYKAIKVVLTAEGFVPAAKRPIEYMTPYANLRIGGVYNLAPYRKGLYRILEITFDHRKQPYYKGL